MSLNHPIGGELDQCIVPQGRSVGLTLCQQIEFVNKETLVLGPGEVKRLRRQELRNTILLIVGVVLQLGHAMDSPSLEA